MNKIIVIGSPGAGKSTFARRLRDLTGIPLYYLDMIWHNTDRTNVTREEFDRELNEILKKDKWIIDGNYQRTLELRIKECDTVFFMDFPLEVCLAGARTRVGKYREDLPWIETEFDEEFRQSIIDFPQKKLSKIYENDISIDPELYTKYDVKRGLRDLNGKGVLVGLTEISDVCSTKIVDGKSVPMEGELYYRGYNVKDLVKGIPESSHFGYRSLPTSFVRDIIMKAPSKDMMNTLARSVLTLYSYDDFADDITIPNVLRQCLQLISLFPLLSVYGYQAYKHYHDGDSLFIHQPKPEYSTAENILHILRADSKFSALEAKLLDIALILHMEHGGGNNSTFTTHLVSSSATDTYSVIAASLGSLKGPKHGGANIKVVQMFDDMKKTVKDWEDEEEVSRYLKALLNKEAFDHAGLIYGMGHAVYSLSDPRAVIFHSFVERLSKEKGKEKEFALYTMVERLAPKIIAEERKIYKGVSPNVDFYSGFAYSMLNLPLELYTPIFAIARISGWSAHRLEELSSNGKIMRPAYKYVGKHTPYIPVEKR